MSKDSDATNLSPEDARLAKICELLEKICAGNQSVCSELISVLLPRLESLAIREDFSEHDRKRYQKHTDSVVQETAIDVWKMVSRGSVHAPVDLLRQLGRIVANNLAQLARREQTHIKHLQNKAESENFDIASEHIFDLENLEISEKIYQEIPKLDRELADVFTCRFLFELKLRQVSALLDVPEATVRLRLRKAIAALRIGVGADFPNFDSS